MLIENDVIRRRLLELYPTQTIRSYFDTVGMRKADVVTEVVDNKPIEQVATFSREHFFFTKHRTYLFNRGPGEHAPIHNLERIPCDVLAIQNGENVSTYGHIHLTYDVTLGNPLDEARLDFAWPFLINVYPRYISVSLVKMEKSIGSFIEEGREVRKVVKGLDEKAFLEQLRQHPSFAGVTLLDIHSGIKLMWRTDKIDAVVAQWRRPNSTTSERMDERCKLKATYPEKYEEVLASPILKSVFVYEEENPPSCTYFECEPSNGYVAFNRYSSIMSLPPSIIDTIIAGNGGEDT